uniref:kinesin-related protein 4-like n=1 Tax=Erigeron canadensis TaxID=72917 RepID=UPI001CB9D7AE|nr:kinesin-related protein 4-like [Erigeron canadensis]
MPITIDFGDGSTQSPDSNDEERTKKGKYKKVSYAKPRYEFVRRKITKVNHKKKLGRPRLRKRKCVHMDYNEETDNDNGEDGVEEEQDDGEQDEAEDNVQEDEVEENVEEDEVEVNIDNEQTDNEVEDLGKDDLEEDSNWEEEEEAQILDKVEESTELESSDAIEEEERCINEEEEVELNVDLQDDEDEGSHYVEKDLNAKKRKGRKKLQEKRLYIRASKKIFYSIMNDLSNKQKAGIKQLGFGLLIKFSIMNVPTRLAYYVLEKFSTKDSVFEVNGNLVLVNKERVHNVFGIPIGGKKIPYSPQILYAHEARKPENFQFPLFKNWDLESLKEIEKEISRNGEFEKVTEEIKKAPVPREVKRKRASERLLECKKMILEQKKGLEDFVDEQDDTRKKSEGVQNEASQKHSQGEEFEFNGCNPFVETQSPDDMKFFKVETEIQKDVTSLDENFEGEIDNIAIQKQDQVQKKTVKSSSKEDQALAGKTTRIEGVREFEKVGDEQHRMGRKTNRIKVDRESLKEKYHNPPKAIEHKQGNQDDKQGSQSKAVESSFQNVGDEGHGIGEKNKNKVDIIEADRKIGGKSIESSVHKVGDANHKIGGKSTTAGLDQHDLMDKIQNPAEANQGNQDKMKVDQRRKIDQILNKLNSKRTILEVNGSEIKKKSGVHKKKKVDPFLPTFDLGFDSPDSVEDGESHGQGDLDETPKVKDLKSLPDTEKVS